MSRFFVAVLLFILPLFGFQYHHKYYTSVTQIEYVENKQSVQIITRIFIDDFENVLQERYDETLLLDSPEKETAAEMYIKKYLTAKMQISINKQPAKLVYVGKEYDAGVVKCYLEIEHVANIKTLEISNTVLFDLFEEQQNMIKTNINSKQKSFTLSKQHQNVLLEF